jgi:hypothetical protein
LIFSVVFSVVGWGLFLKPFFKKVRGAISKAVIAGLTRNLPM